MVDDHEQATDSERDRLVRLLAVAVNRANRLQALTAGLSPLIDEQAIAEYVIDVGIEAVGGSAGALAVLTDEGDLAIASHRGYTPQTMDRYARIPLDAPMPVCDAVRTGRPVFLESDVQRISSYPLLNARPGGSEAHAVVTLATSAGDCLGALTIGFSKAQHFSPEDRAMLMSFGHQCGIAIERARLYRSAEEGRERLAFLAAASKLLGSSLDLDTTMINLIELAVPRVAHWAAIHLVENNRFRSVHSRHRTPEKSAKFSAMLEQFPLRFDTTLGPGAVVRTGEPSIFHRLTDRNLESIATNAEHLALLREIGFGSAIYVALRAQGQVRGVLVVGNEVGHSITDDDVALVQEIAARASAALHNALLYQERSEIARALQASLLPPSLPKIEKLELAARYRPAGSGADVGGDFYDVKQLAPDRWIAVIGDVCGTGIEAAALTGLARHAVLSAGLAHHRPSEILTAVNDILLRESPRSQDQLDSPRFCTMCVMMLEPNDAGVRLTVACAGHPQPFVVAGDQSHQVGADGSLLGVFQEVKFVDVTVQLDVGDTLVAFTDGVTERRNGKLFFDNDGVQAALSGKQGDDAESVARSLEQAVVSFGDAPLNDDMALLVLRVLG
jgi:serine phosphatase RsbU (regulator of sigma subunit)